MRSGKRLLKSLPMRILADRTEIERSQQAFENAVSSAATEQRETRIGHRGKHLDASVYWNPSAGLWAYFDPPNEKRYWNAFGLVEPATAVSITCEINPPVCGINPHFAGVFGRAGGDRYILHRGNFTAGGKIPKDFIRANFDDGCRWISVDDSDRDLLRVGKLSDPRFVYDLRDFVEAVKKLKKDYKTR